MTRRFKLEAVLNHRRHYEDVVHKRYAEAVQLLRKQQDHLAEMEMKHREYRQILRHKLSRGDTAAEILMYTRYLDRLDNEILMQQKVVRAHLKEKEAQRRSLMAAVKDRKVIEKLKEHHQNQLEIEERGREQKLLNEVAITRYQRAGKEA